MQRDLSLTGVERFFDSDQVIVTKTDLKGKITYANDIFRRASEISERDALGAPHNIIRHPDMPRCVFKLLWDTLQGGKEIFAYVLNRAMNGDHYWVYAHVTPSFNEGGDIIGYHSNRREPDQRIIKDEIKPFYAKLLEAEAAHDSPKAGLDASMGLFEATLQDLGMAYDEFVCTLGQQHRRGYR